MILANQSLSHVLRPPRAGTWCDHLSMGQPRPAVGSSIPPMPAASCNRRPIACPLRLIAGHRPREQGGDKNGRSASLVATARCKTYCYAMSHTLTIRLDENLSARLERAADRTRQPVSTVVRQAISEWLERSGQRRATTLLAAAGSVRGSGLSATNENVRAAFRRRRR
ncbi:MAG: CopG family ribbon-helix-helix protein [Myxococcota bacterium]